jgi:hypothetical protein
MRLAVGHLSLDRLVQFEHTSIRALLLRLAHKYRASVINLKADVSVYSR